ncbi:hypothetical protein [Shewanella scandinavica]|uniref:hypothetical protein n=1 Tax=Shewanella scandinavica TaxID=3063538 RepID=UPI00318D17B8
MFGVDSGVIGGIIAVFLCTYFSRRNSRKSSDGNLKYGLFIVSFAWICVFATLGLIYIIIFTDHGGQYIALSVLILIFGAISFFSLSEALGVKGKFDNEILALKTPWTGSKIERWSDLKSVKFNSFCNWYTFTFQNGTKIHLSYMLSGHGLVLEHAKSIGFYC